MDLLAVYPHAAIMMRSGAGTFGVKAGSGYSSFDGNADKIVVNDTTFDFENHTVATNKDQCKDDGYKNFNPPGGPYKNQGQCVSFTNHQGGGND
jgi:hypothetical protein